MPSPCEMVESWELAVVRGSCSCLSQGVRLLLLLWWKIRYVLPWASVLCCVLFPHIPACSVGESVADAFFLIWQETARVGVFCERLCMENPARELSAQSHPSDKGSHLGKWQRRDTWGHWMSSALPGVSRFKDHLSHGKVLGLSLDTASLRDVLQRKTTASPNGRLLRAANSFVWTAGHALKLPYIPSIRAKPKPYSLRLTLLSDKTVCMCDSFNRQFALIMESADNKQ